MNRKRIVCFVEGKGDKAAVPKLAARIAADLGATDAVFIHSEPFTVHGLGTLVKDGCKNWLRWLGAAGKSYGDLGGILLVLDGEPEPVPPKWISYINRYNTRDFCARRVAAVLASDAQSARAGEVFSLAAVFAVKEFEAWLVAGVESLRGVALAENRGTVPSTASAPAGDIEAKRDAKKQLRELVPGYEQSLDQGILAAKVDIEVVAKRCRSFCRLRNAISQLADAVRSGKPMVSPLP